jgi:hypothetical protein
LHRRRHGSTRGRALMGCPLLRCKMKTKHVTE